MKTKEEILDFISDRLDNAEMFVFISKEPDGEDKVKICMLSPSEEEAVMCMMHYLKDNPRSWNALKNTIEKFEIKK